MTSVVVERGRPILYWTGCSHGCDVIRLQSVLTVDGEGLVELDAEASRLAMSAHLSGTHDDHGDDA